ncbi:hypothetical protein ACFWZ2_25875 [Streptomyces sp. NPDC059002]|uniref:effector-associated constant component EACC1 n=1 Tax=Streptomyces sp. NPDC059002 TaxID=3346690 RepID=UPI00369E75BC
MECQHNAGRVRIHVGAYGADGEERTTLDLYAWLRHTADVREHADISLRPAQQDDAETMGAADVIDMVLNHGFAALNLALAYAAWRTARPAAPSVTLTTGRGSVTVHGASDEDIRRIVTALHDTVPAPDDPGGPPGAGPGADPGDPETPGTRQPGAR